MPKTKYSLWCWTDVRWLAMWGAGAIWNSGQQPGDPAKVSTSLRAQYAECPEHHSARCVMVGVTGGIVLQTFISKPKCHIAQAHARQFSHLLFCLLSARMEPENALRSFYWGKYLSSLFLLTNFFSQCVIIMEYKKAISCSTQEPKTVYLGLTQTFPLIDKLTIYE